MLQNNGLPDLREHRIITEDTKDPEAHVMEQISVGQHLLETKWANKYPKLGDMFNDPSERLKASQTAIVLEHQQRYVENLKRRMGEATVVQYFGDLTTKLADVVRIAYPNMVAHDLVNVQTMLSWIDSIFYIKPVYSATKRGATKGNELITSDVTGYASEECSDNIGSGDGATLHFTKTATYVPIRPSSLTILEGGTVIAQDDGNGKFTGSTRLDTTISTVDYSTGTVDITFNAPAPGAGVSIDMEYRYDSEQNADEMGGIDLVFAHYPVQARIHPLDLTWSVSASMAASSTIGVDVEDIVAVTAGQYLKAERDRAVIKDLVRAAGSVSADLTFNAQPSTNTALVDHFQIFMFYITKAESLIQDDVKRGGVSWIVIGTSLLPLVSMVAGWVAEVAPIKIGVYKAGTLNGIPVFVCPYDNILGKDEFLVGYKGTVYGDSGYILAEYIEMYATPTLEFSNFLGKKGVASFYDKKLITQEYYKRGKVTNLP